MAIGFPFRAPTKFLREVATRSALPSIITALPNTPFNSRMGCYFRIPVGESLTQIQVVLPNFYMNAGVETSTGGVMTIQGLSLEYPASLTPTGTPGPRVPLTFSGGNLSVVSAADFIVSDLVTLATPITSASPLGRIWFQWQNSNVIPFCTQGPYKSVSGMGDALRQTSTNFTLTGTYTDDGTVNNMVPCRIMGMTSGSKDVMFIGDSLTVGSGESTATQDSTGDCGQSARPYGAAHPYFRLGQISMQAVQFVATHAKQIALANLALPSAIVLALATNDLSVSRNATQIQADLVAIAGLFPSIPIILETVVPRSTSTDSWVTLVNQTTNFSNAQRITLNTSIRAGISPFGAALDVASILESSLNSGLWGVTGSSGINAFTIDGIHGTRTANLLIPAQP